MTLSLQALKQADQRLIETLARRYTTGRKRGEWRNRALQQKGALCASERGLATLQQRLERAGAFSIKCERVRWVDSDGEKRIFTLARAASTEMWPMGTHYWVRDNALIGARYLFSRDRRYTKVGKELLLSNLTFMSSKAQLSRCRKLISASSDQFRKDPANWPYIFAGIRDNLTTRFKEGWAHKQDAWQIAVFYLLEALEEGLISPRDLTPKHKQFIGLIVPFLAKISCWRCENSGSWEELPAVRASVRAWEHRLLVKLAKLSLYKEYPFISKQFLSSRKHLAPSLRSKSLLSAVTTIERKITTTMLRDLPWESPHYRKRDARYRKGDAALIYLLLMDYPYFLAARLGKDHRWAHRLEAKILKSVSTLEDPVTGGIHRYGNDSYQRSGYFRNVTIHRLQAVYGAPSSDASQHFTARDSVVPKGRRAAWTHFVWQLAAWSGRRHLETGSIVYRRLHDRYFMQGLSLLTGQREVSISQDASGRPHIIALPALRMPECYISERTSTGQELVFPSPHTPLNWAIAEMFHAFGVRREILQGAAQRK